MSYSSKINDWLIGKIESLVSDLCPSFSVPDRRFVCDVAYGILRSKSLVLGDIAHALGQKTVLRKAIQRLSTHLTEGIPECLRETYADRVLTDIPKDRAVFLVDDSDIAKIYGKSFEALDVITDASKTDKPKVRGYHVTCIVGLSISHRQPIAVYDRVHSVKEEGYKSMNDITFRAIDIAVRNRKDFTAIFVCDRGYDRSLVFEKFSSVHQHFLIRGKENRRIIAKNRKIPVFGYARMFKGKYATKIRVRGIEYDAKVTSAKVRLSGFETDIYMIICFTDQDRDEPIKIFYTDIELNDKDETLRVLRLYSERWKIEEFFRFKKQEQGMERFRVRTLKAINYLGMIEDITVLLMAEMIESGGEIYNALLSKAKDYDLSPIIGYYRLAQGISIALHDRKSVFFKAGRRERDIQLSLFAQVRNKQP